MKLRAVVKYRSLITNVYFKNNNMNEIERDTINEIVKKIKVRIKFRQEDIKNCYTQEEVWINQGIERELIDLKIELEKYRKSFLYN